MRDPFQFGSAVSGDDAPDSGNPSLQRWIKENYADEDQGKRDQQARELRAENNKRFLKSLSRSVRAARVS